MTSQEINTETIGLVIITGIIFSIANIILRYFLRINALNTIKKNLLADEFIVNEPKFTFSVDYIMPFIASGTIIGGSILPYFILPESQIIWQKHKHELPIYLIIGLFAVLYLLLISSTKFVLTNKRMIYSCPFKFLYGISEVFLQFNYLNYSDIKKFDYEKPAWTTHFCVYTNNYKKYRFNLFKNNNEFPSIIEKYRKISEFS